MSSVRGAPGVTSWALLLAAAWPVGPTGVGVMLEADCSGGVVGARYQLGVDPGAVSLVSACRNAADAPSPEAHGRLVAPGVWVVPGPEIAEQAVPVWRSGVLDVASALERDGSVWIADLGRLGPGNPTAPLTDAAAVNVVVCGSAIEDIVQVPARVVALGEGAPAAVIVCGRAGYREEELHRFLGGRALFAVPDAKNLPHLALRAVRGGRARRSSLWRAAVEVAADLATLAHGRRPPNALDAPRKATTEQVGTESATDPSPRRPAVEPQPYLVLPPVEPLVHPADRWLDTPRTVPATAHSPEPPADWDIAELLASEAPPAPPQADEVASPDDDPPDEAVFSDDEPAAEVASPDDDPPDEVVFADDEPADEVVFADDEPADEVVFADPEPPAEVVFADPEPSQRPSAPPDVELAASREVVVASDRPGDRGPVPPPELPGRRREPDDNPGERSPMPESTEHLEVAEHAEVAGFDEVAEHAEEAEFDEITEHDELAEHDEVAEVECNDEHDPADDREGWINEADWERSGGWAAVDGVWPGEPVDDDGIPLEASPAIRAAAANSLRIRSRRR